MPAQCTWLPGSWPVFCLGRALPAQKEPLAVTMEVGFCPARAICGRASGLLWTPICKLSMGIAKRWFYVCPEEHMVCVATTEAVAAKSQALLACAIASLLGTGDGATCSRPATDCGGPGSKYRPRLPAAGGPVPPHSASRSQHAFLAGGCAHMWVASSCSQRCRVDARSPGGSGSAFSTSSREPRWKSEWPEDDRLGGESLTFTAEWDQRGEMMSGTSGSIPSPIPSIWRTL